VEGDILAKAIQEIFPEDYEVKVPEGRSMEAGPSDQGMINKDVLKFIITGAEVMEDPAAFLGQFEANTTQLSAALFAPDQDYGNSTSTPLFSETTCSPLALTYTPADVAKTEGSESLLGFIETDAPDNFLSTSSASQGGGVPNPYAYKPPKVTTMDLQATWATASKNTTAPTTTIALIDTQQIANLPTGAQESSSPPMNVFSFLSTSPTDIKISAPVTTEPVEQKNVIVSAVPGATATSAALTSPEKHGSKKIHCKICNQECSSGHSLASHSRKHLLKCQHGGCTFAVQPEKIEMMQWH
jgi:hypothetical protein